MPTFGHQPLFNLIACVHSANLQRCCDVLNLAAKCLVVAALVVVPRRSLLASLEADDPLLRKQIH